MAGAATVIMTVAALSLPASALVVRWYWEPPTTGSPVEYYEFYWSLEGAEYALADTTSTPEIILTMPEGITTVKVRGVDAFARAGIFSPESIFEDIGAPGGCGPCHYEIVSNE